MHFAKSNFLSIIGIYFLGVLSIFFSHLMITRTMNPSFFKVLKSLAVVLLLLEFLTPAVENDGSMLDQADQYQQHVFHLKLKSHKKPLLFLTKGRLRCFFPPMLLCQPSLNFAKRGLNLPALSCSDEQYDTHPPLFRLHRLLLL